jgi:hypothetical protein
MAIVTATEVCAYTDISASAGTIVSLGLVDIVQERINYITNNFFLADMYMGGTVTFSATAGTITAGSDWDVEGFVAGDEIYIYNSFRNDGYKIVGSVTTTVLTLASGSSVVNEPSGRSIMVNVVKFPNALKYIAAQMVKYDYDDRPKKAFGVTSRSLGPYSESFGGQSGTAAPSPYGYPQELVDALSSWTIARLN